MTTLYTIRDWNKHFETAQSRVVKRLAWVSIPNKHDGKSYRRLMRREGGPAMYGAWILIVQVASTCPKRGVLADSDGPLTAEDIAVKTDAPTELIEVALKVLCSPEIRWMEARECENGDSTLIDAMTTLPIHHITSPDITSHHRTEQNNKVDIDIDQKNSSNDFDSDFDSHVLHIAEEIAKRTGTGGPKDQKLLLDVANLAVTGQLRESDVIEAANGVRERRQTKPGRRPLRTPFAYFRTSLHNAIGVGSTPEAILADGQATLKAMLADARPP